MKKNYLTLLLFLPLSCLAQVELTLYGGPTATFVSFKHSSTKPNYKALNSKTGQFAIGMRAAYKHTDRLSWESGLRIVRKHYNSTIRREFEDHSFFEFEQYHRLVSWEVPLTSVYHIPLYSIDRDLVLRTGITVNFNELRQNGSGIGGGGPDLLLDYHSFSFTNAHKPKRITTGAEVGVSIKPLVWDLFELGFLFHYDLQAVNRQENYTAEFEMYNTGSYFTEKVHGNIKSQYSYYLMLQLGYTFGKRED